MLISQMECRTAEDLTATSRRLARYETLLNEIFPMVSPEVRNLIEEARDHVSLALRVFTQTQERARFSDSLQFFFA